MNLILKIARTELRNLYYSPVAWFISIAFLIQCGFFYTKSLLPLANWQDVLIKNNPRFKGWESTLTQAVFLAGDSIFTNVLTNLYLFVPLLTMALVSREINNGTIKLLYSSPVKTRLIVLGKYLAISLYNLLLVGIVGVFMVTGAFNIKSIDYGLLLSATLGFYLLVCAYAAIGLFMSTLSTYQVISAIATFTLIFILARIGNLWQQYDIVRDLTYFLSLSGRTFRMLKGLITTNDVIYFLVITGLFISFTLFRLRGGREYKPWYVKVLRNASLLTIALLIGYVASRPNFIGYWDTTAGKVNTIHWRTQQIIKEMGNEPLEVTLYTNLLGPGSASGLPVARNAYLWNLWEPYVRFKPDIRFRYAYYYDAPPGDSSVFLMFPGKKLDEISWIMADAMGIDISTFESPEAMYSKVDLRPEECRLVMQLKYKGRTTFLRTFDDSKFWPDEEHIAAALKRLLAPVKPTFVFTTGNLERSIYKKGEREFNQHAAALGNRSSLVNNGFDCDTVNLDVKDIPAGIDALVLADPKTELSAVTMDKLRRYISGGGNLVIYGEPGKQHLLNPLLQQLDVQLMPGTLVQVTKNEMPHMLKPYMTPLYMGLSEEPLGIRALKEWKFGDSVFPLLPGAAAIDYSNNGAFRVQPLLLTQPGKVWIKTGRLVTDSVAPVFNAREGDIRRNTFAASVALTRQMNNREQRIVIMGDADMFSSLRAGGGWMGRSICSWIDYNDYPIYTPRPVPADDLLKINAPGVALLKTAFVWILPGFLLIMGTILLIRRKRQ